MNDPLLKALANALVTFKLQTLFHFSKLDNAFLSHGSEIGPHSLLRAIFLSSASHLGLHRFFTLCPSLFQMAMAKDTRTNSVVCM